MNWKGLLALSVASQEGIMGSTLDVGVGRLEELGHKSLGRMALKSSEDRNKGG